MNTLKAMQTSLPLHNPSLTRPKRSTLCRCNSDGAQSSPSPQGDKRQQDMLARIAMLQAQKVRLTDFLDERSAYLSQFAEDANADFDKLGEDALKELDEASARIMEKLENQAQAFEESAEISRQEIEKNEKVLEDFEDAVDRGRNEGLFFKSMSEKSTSPEKKKEFKAEAEKIKEVIKDDVGLKIRTNIYLGLMSLVALTIGNAVVASPEVEWRKVGAWGFVLIGLVAQLTYERSLSSSTTEKQDEEKSE